jgi:hypothetical protein
MRLRASLQNPLLTGKAWARWVKHFRRSELGPLRDWLEKLKKSAGVAFIDYDGATEAKLLQEGDQIPELAVEVVGRSLLIGRIDA